MSGMETTVLLSMKHLIVFTLSMPIFSLLFSVIWSLAFHFEHVATDGYCEGPEVLPCVSTAVSAFAPQMYVWRVCIALHSFPRFLFCLIEHKDNLRRDAGKNGASNRSIIYFNSLMHVIENFSLVLLTYVPTGEFHNIYFGIFMGSSQLYMGSTCVLLKKNARCGDSNTSYKENQVWKKQLAVFVFNDVCAWLVTVVYCLHKWYCFPAYGFTVFALLEYFIIGSNILFHGIEFVRTSSTSSLLLASPVAITTTHSVSNQANKSKSV